MPFRGAIPVAKEQLAQTGKRCSIKRYHHVSDWFIYTFLLCNTLHVLWFYQNRFNEDACAHYTDALIREIEMEADSVLHQSAPSTRSISVAARLPRFLHTI